jgi:CrcB protein
LFLFTGMIGAFTTFSTFALESLQLMQRGDVVGGLTNIAVSTGAGLLLVVAGMTVAQHLIEAVAA